MKKKYYISIAIVAYLLFLVATIPASPVTNLISDNSPVNIKGVSGTLWQGKAYMVSINNNQLLNTEWSFFTWKLLLGRLAIDVNTEYQGSKISTELGSSFLGRFFINDLTATLPANEVAKLANIPLAQLSGSISFNIEHAQWKQGELPEASGEINWKEASVTVADTVSLGQVSILLNETQQNLLNADINNKGGDIIISGNAELVPEANYAINLKLTPTATASNNIKQSLSLFATKQANGEFLLKNTGSLNQIGLM